MPNPTCRLLSNGYKFEIDHLSNIFYRPCCHFPEFQMLDAPPDQHRAHLQRLNNINSYESDTCGKCNYENGNKLRTTWRDRSFDIVPDDAELGDASCVEIQVDKVCNGGCIICGPSCSTYWQNELKQFPIKPAVDPIDRILAHIDIRKARRITFVGGEPFLSNTDLKVLSQIDQPELLSISYPTNGSLYPSDRHIGLWSRLKSVTIGFSLDGIGDRFGYIRYPLKWSEVEKNIQRMMKEMPENVVFRVNHTVNPLNIYYYDEFLTWHEQVMTPAGAMPFHFTPCDGTLSPMNLPRKLVNRLIDKYGEDSKVVRTVVNRDCDDHSEMLAYLSELDTRRDQDWKQVFPEISDCF